jgi:hypothetical protein
LVTTCTLVFNDKGMLIIVTATAKCFGDGLKASALSMHFVRNIRPNAQLILDALARGEDPAKTVPVGSEGKAGKGQTVVSALNVSSSSHFLYVQAI